MNMSACKFDKYEISIYRLLHIFDHLIFEESTNKFSYMKIHSLSQSTYVRKCHRNRNSYPIVSI